MIRIVLHFFCFVLLTDLIITRFLPQYASTVWAIRMKRWADASLGSIRRLFPPTIPSWIPIVTVIIAIQIIVWFMLIRLFVYLYCLILVLDVAIWFMPQFEKEPWAAKIRNMSNWTSSRVRNILSDKLPPFVAPIVVIVILMLLVPMRWLW
jgi:hypothetical protein